MYCLKCGNSDPRYLGRQTRPRTVLNDGTTLSIQVGHNLYCEPRENEAPNGYSAVEVGFIANPDNSQITPPDEWKDYADGSFPSDVYGYVPIEIVERFIAAHGGRKNYV